MPDLEINLDILAEASRIKHAENLSFKKILRHFPSTALDALVEQLNAEIEQRIDCKVCANCCKGLHAAAFEHELSPLAEAKRISVEQFKSDFLRPHKDMFYFASKPCPMLNENNLCDVYAERPICCQTFPNLVGEHFKYRFGAVMEKYGVCPIVFIVVEKLKSVLGFENAF